MKRQLIDSPCETAIQTEPFPAGHTGMGHVWYSDPHCIPKKTLLHLYKKQNDNSKGLLKNCFIIIYYFMYCVFHHGNMIYTWEL